MARLYILIKRKGSSKWIGAIPAKAGATRLRIRALMRKQLKKGFSYKIISEPALKRMAMNMSRTRRPVRRRTVKRRKRTIKRRR